MMSKPEKYLSKLVCLIFQHQWANVNLGDEKKAKQCMRCLKTRYLGEGDEQ